MRPARSRPASRRFNGAALKRVRRRTRWHWTLESHRWLQWGRTQKSAETRQNALRLAEIFEASMGPHSKECGDESAVARSPAIVVLQWGRTQKSAETGHHPRHATRTRIHASMGPHSKECGDTPLATRARRPDRAASMGPHSKECGDDPDGHRVDARGARFNGAALKRVRRRGPMMSRRSPRNALQWGRTQKSAETLTASSRTGPCSDRFNGAALKRVRRRAGSSRPRCWWGCFNGAALKRVRRPSIAWVIQSQNEMLQWGRTQKSAETRRLE